MKQQQNTYRLVYVISGVERETIIIGNRGLCTWKKEEVIKAGTHKNGLLQVRRVP